MKNNFAEIYSQHEALAARYNEASQKNDREGMEQARDEHRALNEKVAAHGRAYARLYELYADARERGNDYIDLSEIYDYKDCLLYTSPSPRDGLLSRMPSSA